MGKKKPKEAGAVQEDGHEGYEVLDVTPQTNSVIEKTLAPLCARAVFARPGSELDAQRSICTALQNWFAAEGATIKW